MMTPKDRHRLRSLASEVAFDASKPIQQKRMVLWQQHNDLETTVPPVYVFLDGSAWREIITQETLQCEDPLARDFEFMLLQRLFQERSIRDDTVNDGNFTLSHVYSDTGWNLNWERIGEGDGKAYKVNPCLTDYERDFPKLRFPKYVVDAEKTAQRLEIAHNVFDGILNVKLYNSWFWTRGLTVFYIRLRGLENFMYDFIDEPEWVHRMMEFLCTGTLQQLDDLGRAGLLYQNTGNHWVGSGALGFTNQLKPVAQGSVTPMDIWGFTESQETTCISPDMYGEFVFPYHKRIAECFGLNCHGCCEPYEGRWKYIRNLPRLRRISCSPWSDRSTMEPNFHRDYIASVKLNPAYISQTPIDETVVRNDARVAAEASRNIVAEFIMKDVHTIGHNPDIPVRWVEIMREEIDRAYAKT